MTPSAVRRMPSKFSPWLLATVMGLGSALLPASAVMAQQAFSVPVAQLLFEARPLPLSGAEPALVAAGAVPSAVVPVEENPATRAELDAEQEKKLQDVVATYGENSMEAAAAQEAFADWHVKAFLERSTVASSISRVNGGAYANMRNTAPQGGTSGDVANLAMDNNPLQSTMYSLHLARTGYLKALYALSQSSDLTNPALLDLERKFQKTLFLTTHRENIIYEPDFYLSRRATATGTRLDVSTQQLLNSDDYDQGLVSFSRQLEYIDKNRSRTAEQIARTLLEEADWDLVFARVPQAAEKYDGAFQFFESSPVVKERAQALVTPSAPVVVPAFMPAPNSRERLGIPADADVSYFGYIDVSFGVQKNGRARSIKVLGRGGSADKAMETRLREYIGKVTFRPNYDGDKLDTGSRSWRYYISY